MPVERNKEQRMRSKAMGLRRVMKRVRMRARARRMSW
jgi:hypothetical protein